MPSDNPHIEVRPPAAGLIAADLFGRLVHGWEARLAAQRRWARLAAQRRWAWLAAQRLWHFLATLQGRRHPAIAVAVTLVPALAFGALVLERAVRSNLAAEDARLAQCAHAIRLSVDTLLHGYIAGIAGLALSPNLDQPGNLQAFGADARDLQALLGARIALFGPPPRLPLVVSAAGPAWPGAEGREDVLQPFLAMMFQSGHPVAVDRLPSGVDGGPRLAVVAPVVRRGSVRFALAAWFSPSGLGRLVAAAITDASGMALIVDGHGQLVAQTGAPPGVDAAAWWRDSAEAQGAAPHGAAEYPDLAPSWTLMVTETHAAYRTAALHGLGLLGLAMCAALGCAAAGAVALVHRGAADEAAMLHAGREQVEMLHGGLPVLMFLTRKPAVGPDVMLYRGGDPVAVVGWSREALSPADGCLHTIWDRCKEAGAPSGADIIARAVAEGRATCEYRFRRDDGTWVWLRTSHRLLTRHADGSADVVGYVLNITAEREAYAQLLSAGRLTALGELAAGLAHELKQPLAVISMAAENGDNALRLGDSAAVHRKFTRIAEQAQRVGGLIEHLRRFARGGEADGDTGPVPLRDVVAGALTIAGGALRDAQVTLELDLPASLPAAHCQRVPLEQVFVNLFINARDAIAAGPAGAPRWLRVTAAAVQQRIVVSIGDSGGGLPAAVLARLFEPFVSTKDPGSGTGLGLAMCHSLMRGMDAEIAARNGAVGAVFTLTLRAAAV